MATLFLDSSFGLSIGLLDENLKVLDYEFFEEKKQSSILHPQIFKKLQAHNLSIKDIKNIVMSAGPGSYTGMRLSAGLADILRWQNVAVYTFYHFELPEILNFKNYIWCSKAFKSEIFCYDGENKKTWRIQESQLDNFLEINSSKKMVTFSKAEITSTKHLDNFIEMKNLLSDNLASICKVVIDNKQDLELYYYRSIEEEFKVPTNEGKAHI